MATNAPKEHGFDRAFRLIKEHYAGAEFGSDICRSFSSEQIRRLALLAERKRLERGDPPFSYLDSSS